MSGTIIGAPILQMNKAFNALSDLIPYITDSDKFMQKENESYIKGKITDLQTAFKNAKHDVLIKEDLFAPSYKLINENISDSLIAFKEGKKEYAHWRLKETTSLCMDCHTRMPPTHPSSFQSGELTIDKTKFDDVYNLGIAQLIVRNYVEAKQSFTRSIQDRIIKKSTFNIILPFKQLLLIDTKVLKSPENLEKELTRYLDNKEMPVSVKNTLRSWVGRLQAWKTNKYVKAGLQSETDVANFIKKELVPLKPQPSYEAGRDVDLLFASGLLSNYLFENPTSKMAPEIGYWIGWSEKHLKRENFFGSGDLFLKQCIRRYPTNPIAKKCLSEYEESINFEFSGSSGTHIPDDVKKELEDLKSLLK
jgi:hypothetical protein